MKILKWFAVTLGIAISILWGLSFWTHIDSGAHEFTSKFESFELGSPVAVAIEQLGKPTDTSTEFRLGHEKGFEDSYQRAQNSTAVVFYIWSCCIDMTYTLGADPDGYIVVIEHTGT